MNRQPTPASVEPSGRRALSQSRRAYASTLAAAFLLLLLPSFASAQDVAITAMHTRKEPLELFERVRVTLAVEGSVPLRVELPQPLLAAESQEIGSIGPVGPVTVSPAGVGREKWVQDFLFDPYVPGEWYVRFAPVKVNGRDVDGPGFPIAVKPADVKEAQGVTGIEKLPPPQPPGSSFAAVWWAAGALAVLAVAVLAWRLRPRPAPVSPAAWAAAAFGRLERDGLSGAALVERVAAVVREFVERRFGIPATKLTTPELLAAAEQAGRPVEETDALRGILDHCDRAKFAGDVPDDDGCRGLLAAGRDWVDRVSAADAGPG
jgi:hypothetical protein